MSGSFIRKRKCVGDKGCGYIGLDEEFEKGYQGRLKCPQCGKNHTFMGIRENMNKNKEKVRD